MKALKKAWNNTLLCYTYYQLGAWRCLNILMCNNDDDVRLMKRKDFYPTFNLRGDMTKEFSMPIIQFNCMNIKVFISCHINRCKTIYKAKVIKSRLCFIFFILTRHSVLCTGSDFIQIGSWKFNLYAIKEQ